MAGRLVICGEGRTQHHQRGAVESQWPTVTAFKDVGVGTGLFKSQEEWKRVRDFLQTDLLSPSAAKGYLNPVNQAAASISAGLPQNTNNLEEYIAKSSFDLFSSVLLGKAVSTAQGTDEGDEDVKLFSQSIFQSTKTVVPVMLSPYERVMHLAGFKTKLMKDLTDSFQVANDVGMKKLQELADKKEKGLLDEDEQQSYMSKALERLKDADNITMKDVNDICITLLIASVDTTSALLLWLLVHLALNPQVQDKLYEELQAELQGGPLTKEVASKGRGAWLPYLHAVVRESHRLTPAFVIPVFKKNSGSPLVVCGYEIPQGNLLGLDSHSIQNDPKLVPDADKFIPERFLPEAVNLRKGTDSEILDHPLLRDPFSAGARKCPGSRVANLEVLTVVSKFVNDWRITTENPNLELKDIKYFLGLTTQPTVPKLKFERR